MTTSQRRSARGCRRLVGAALTRHAHLICGTVKWWSPLAKRGALGSSVAVAQGGRVWQALAVLAVSASPSLADDGDCRGLTGAELAELSSDGVPGPDDALEGSLCSPLTRLLGLSGGVPVFFKLASILRNSSRPLSAEVLGLPEDLMDNSDTKRRTGNDNKSRLDRPENAWEKGGSRC